MNLFNHEKNKELFCCICGEPPTKHWYNGKKYCEEHLLNEYAKNYVPLPESVAVGLILYERTHPKFYKKALAGMKRHQPELLEAALKIVNEKKQTVVSIDEKGKIIGGNL